MAAAFLASAGCGRGGTGLKSSSAATNLSNGLRVISLHFPQSTNVGLFLYSPMGLASDPPGHAQWSHLVEHMVIRSTSSGVLTNVNAETLPDHLRLDFYGHRENWRTGLEHVKRWLEGEPFTEENLAAEKPNILSECDYTVANLATHKFGLAAWGQAVRHGRSNVLVRADVEAASLKDVQRYRDERLGVPGRTLLCIVGGLRPEEVIPIVTEQLSPVSLTGKLPEAVEFKVGRHEATWDLAANHMVLSWAAPAAIKTEYATLLALAQWLNTEFHRDSEYKSLAGLMVAGADLFAPEGARFYVSASVRSTNSFAPLEEKILKTLSSVSEASREISGLGQQMGILLQSLPDPSFLYTGALQAAAGSPAMMEMNMGLQWATWEYRFGENKDRLASLLKNVDVATVPHLQLNRDTCIGLTLQPR